MEENRILVIGGSGFLGQPVAMALAEHGYRVRLLVRNEAAARQQLGAGFEYAVGDVTDEASVAQALQGCTGVHVSLASGHDPARLEQVQHQGTARVARLAATQGIAQLTYVSGYLAQEQFADRIAGSRAKLNAEQAIQRSGVPHTIFRPMYFIDTLPQFVQGKRASIFGAQPHPIRFLARADFARMVVAAHQHPGENAALFVCGPEALTFEQALNIYVQQCAPGVAVSHSPFWMMHLINRLFLGGQLTEVLQLMAVTEKVGDKADPSAAIRRFGPATTTVAAWCQQQAQRTPVAVAA